MNRQSQITGKKIVYSVDNTSPDHGGIVPSLSQVRVNFLNEHSNNEDTQKAAQLTSFHDFIGANVISNKAVITKDLNETKVDLVETESKMENKSLVHAELPNNLINIAIPKTILSPCSIDLSSYVRTKERVFEEATILATLKRYMGAFEQSTHLLRIGSVFYRIASQKTDFNILVLPSK